MLPIFGRRHIGAMQRNAICLALAIPQAPDVFSQILGNEMGGTWLVLLAIKEVILGVMLGILAALPFWIFRGALTLVDNQRGANAAQMANPSLEADSSILGELGERLLIVWLIQTGAFILLFELVVDSTVLWPVLEAWPSRLLNDGTPIWLAFANLTAKTLLFAAPILMLLIFIEMAMAFTSSGIKGIDVYQLSMPIKSLAALVLIGLAGHTWFYRGIDDAALWWRYGIIWTLGGR